MTPLSERRCRECGIEQIELGMLDHRGEQIAWVDDDLCSTCQDDLVAAIGQDAARYRYLRNRRQQAGDLDAGGVFVGRPAEGIILGGEDLDRAVDREMVQSVETGVTLERRLALCLADAVDTPVMKVRDTLGGPEIELRLGAWLPEISERAAELLEEAGL